MLFRVVGIFSSRNSFQTVLYQSAIKLVLIPARILRNQVRVPISIEKLVGGQIFGREEQLESEQLCGKQTRRSVHKLYEKDPIVKSTVSPI